MTSSTASAPDTSCAPNIACMPPAAPPAAPARGMSVISMPNVAASTEANCARPASSRATACGVAPFCGPNTAAAPFGPHNGFRTSHATRIATLASRGSRPDRSMRCTRAASAPIPVSSWPDASRKCPPSARTSPIPPSVVALPPTATTIVVGLKSSAARSAGRCRRCSWPPDRVRRREGARSPRRLQAPRPRRAPAANRHRHRSRGPTDRGPESPAADHRGRRPAHLACLRRRRQPASSTVTTPGAP